MKLRPHDPEAATAVVCCLMWFLLDDSFAGWLMLTVGVLILLAWLADRTRGKWWF